MKLASLLVMAGATIVSSFSGQPVAIAVAPPRAEPVAIPSAPPSPAAPEVAWATALAPLRFTNTKHGAACSVRLYAADGSLDPVAAASVDRVLAEPGADARPLDRRLLQLLVRATAHFQVHDVEVVSSWRDSGRGGSHHRRGEAIDFRFPGVSPLKLAAYLRKGARVGVGVYTHPRTQFVHLDVREHSYHWGDGSPPGRVWRESAMTDRGAAARDDAYQVEQDLPDPG